MAQYRLSFGNIGWRGRVGLVVATAVGIAAAIALVLLSLGLAIILLPVVAIVLLVGRWRLRQMMTAAARDYGQRQDDPRAAPATRTIETDYTVIDDKGR
jgi:ABC-type transport system involved in cytochrome bd biosynthesis fused ATPase/permease subunit